LLDRATTLDPQFIAAYEYGGVVLPAINEADAIRLLNKGITNNPNTWRLYHHLGYLYWQRKEYETASQIYLQASHLPDAPRWLLQMSAQMKAAGGSYDVARDMYRQMADAADNPEIKKLAESRLLQIHSLEERDAIRQALQDFRARHGRCPAQWQEITAALRAVRLSNKQPLYFDAAGVPLDPADTPYRLTENGCQVDLDPKSRVPYK
jgi:tetratricopeptide (TPR) repeat protein